MRLCEGRVETRSELMQETSFLSFRFAVSRIALVKPERARAIEQLLMRMAQSGQLRGRVSEEQLIDVLDQVSLELIALSLP